MAPNRLNRAASSAGMASAPEPQTRTEERSRSAAPASSIMRYMAGTPTNMVARRDSMASSTLTGLNEGRKNTGMPAQAMPSTTAKPMMCDTGSDTTASSRRSPAGHAAAAATLPDQAPMGELGTLRLAGGARRVEEGGEVVGTGGHRRRERFGVVDLGGPVDHQRGPRVAHHVGDLAGRHLRLTGAGSAPAREAARHSSTCS